jgi:hypothetical protein
MQPPLHTHNINRNIGTTHIDTWPHKHRKTKEEVIPLQTSHNSIQQPHK